MANICTVILSGDVPECIHTLPCVKNYGVSPIRTLEPNDMRSLFGTTIIYTYSVLEVINVLVASNISKDAIYWQDLDGYGAAKIFKCPL